MRPAIALAFRPQPVNQLRAEVVTATVFPVAAHADDIDQVRIHLEALTVELDQARKVIFFRVAIRRHAHYLELAIQHVKAKVLGERTVHATG